MKSLGGMEWPVGIAEKLPRQEHSIGLTGRHYLFCLHRLGDGADRSAGNSDFSTHSGRKGDLKTWAERNRLIWNDKSAWLFGEVFGAVKRTSL